MIQPPKTKWCISGASRARFHLKPIQSSRRVQWTGSEPRMKAEKAIEILLVEDNPGDARLAQEAIREAKWDNHLNWVHDGMEALHFLRRQGRYSSAPRPDLILLDLNLPRKDGREVLAEIKTDQGLRRIPVIVLSTSDAEEDVLRAYRLKANSYISKPANLNEYVRIVKSLQEFWFSVVKLPSE